MCKVSIIVPVYNVEKYIEDMLMSVQYQTMTDFEVIVVNDGSTDGSQRIIDSFCREDERFHSFVKANGGVASATRGWTRLAANTWFFMIRMTSFLTIALRKCMGQRVGERLT